MSFPSRQRCQFRPEGKKKRAGCQKEAVRPVAKLHRLTSFGFGTSGGHHPFSQSILPAAQRLAPGYVTRQRDNGSLVSALPHCAASSGPVLLEFLRAEPSALKKVRCTVTFWSHLHCETGRIYWFKRFSVHKCTLSKIVGENINKYGYGRGIGIADERENSINRGPVTRTVPV